MPVTSCLRATILRVSLYPCVIKSESTKTMAFFFITLLRYLSAWLRSVFLLLGLNSSNSLMILKMCDFPFFGGTNSSIWSVNNIIPTLSLFCIAEKARVATISVMISFLNWASVPKNSDPLISAISIRVSSRSSSKTLICGSLYRAVTFQSMLRTSSPYWY